MAGRASGVEDGVEVVALSCQVVHRLGAGNGALERRAARRRRAIVHVNQLAGTQLSAQFGRHAGEMSVDDEHLRARLAQGVGDLGERPADVERHDHRARPGHGEEQLDVAVVVHGQNGNAIADVDAGLPQCPRDERRPPVHFAPGQRSLARPDSDPVGLHARGAAQRLCDLHGRLAQRYMASICCRRCGPRAQRRSSKVGVISAPPGSRSASMS